MPKSIKVPSINSIYSKMIAAIVVTTGLVAATITYTQSRQNNALISGLVADMSYNQAHLLSDLISGAVKFGKAEQVNRVLEQVAETSDGRFASSVTLGPTGDVLSQIGGAPDAELVAMARKAIKSGKAAASEDGLKMAVPVRFGPQKSIVGAVAINWSVEGVRTAISDAMVTVMILAGGVFLVAVAGALLAMNGLFFKPLKGFGSAIKSMATQEFDQVVPFQGRNDEVGAFGKNLEALRIALQEGAEAQRDALYGSAAFRGTSACLMLLDEDFTIRHLNDGMTELFRGHVESIRQTLPTFDPENLKGQPIETFHPDSTPIRNALKNLGKDPHQAILRFGEATISLKINGIRNGKNELTGYVLEWLDVTNTMLNEAIVEAIDNNQLMIQFDLSGDVLDANSLIETSLGLSDNEMQRLSMEKIVKGIEGSKGLKEIVASAIEGRPYLGKLNLQGDGGKTVCVEGSLNCVRDRSGRPTRILVMGRDITVAETELQAARQERRESHENQTAVVDALRVGLKKLSEGDLTSAIDVPFFGAYEELRLDFNSTVGNLANALQKVAESAENIHNEASDISSTADGLSRRTEATAATLEQAAAALDELTSSVKSTAVGATQADEAVTAAKENAENSGKVVLETVSAMDQIADSSNRITSIIKVIDDIAFQTNLLALNAGVEAARAGDAGRGFAVVASEVRALAQRSSDAAQEINELIARSGSQVKTGVELVGKTGEALQEIVSSVTEITSLVSNIALSSQQQSQSLVEINGSITQLDQSTQQNAARLEETTAASDALRNDALKLVETVSHFSISSNRQSSNRAHPGEGRSKRNQANASGRPSNLQKGTTTRIKVNGENLGREPGAEDWEDF